MNIEKIKKLSLKEFYNWPVPFQLTTGVILFIVMMVAGSLLWIKGTTDKLDSAEKKEEKLKKEFLDKKKQAVNISLYTEQLLEVQTDSEKLLKQLPNNSEIANLLVDINQVGLSRGLKFELFKPEKEKLLDFYAELPVSIRVKGSYKAIGEFASDLAQLSRVVILTDMTMTANKDDGLVYLDVVAKTFRYLDQNELESQKKAREEAKKAADKKKKTK